MMVDKNRSDKPRRRRGRKLEDGTGKLEPKKETREESSLLEFQFKPHKSQLIHLTEETPTWYECGRHTPGRDETIFTDPPPSSDIQSSQLVAKYRSLADSIYKVEMQLFGNSNGSSSDERWVETTMKKGTLKDRVASMSVVVSTSPVHKLYALDGLLHLAGCSESASANSRVAQMAAEALSDLFLNTLLPPDRKLLTLDQRPLYRYSSEKSMHGNKTLSPRILLLWRYEEMIKNKFQLFVHHYLTHTLREGMQMSKLFALRTSGSLLRSVPEGEAQLLSIMVNKLGDPGKKIAAAAGHELRRVLDQHPSMQVVVAREVQQLSHRPHLSPRALYNCIIFLNQLKLVREEGEQGIKKPSDEESDGDDSMPKKGASPKTPSSLPASLINTYFRLFEVAVNKTKSEDPHSSSGMKSRLLSALLTGVNRAHPYLPASDKHMEEHIDALYRIVHTSPPSACTQALMLLFHLAVGSQNDDVASNANKLTEAESARQDRFYRALYAKLSQPSLLSAGKHLTMFFNLLYKAMKYDTEPVRVNTLAKRLLCTTMHCNASVMAGSLFLINEVMKYHPSLKSCFEEIVDDRDATVVLDPTKREPKAALTRLQDTGTYKKLNEEELPKRAALWEDSLVSHHFHPSVSKFATSLSCISYTGDPLRDFTLAPFLDKFAYRNPKSAKSIAQHWKRGESVAERRTGNEGGIGALMSLPVNDPAFLEKPSFTEQEEFFRKFFVERARRDEMKGIVRGKGAADAELEEIAEWKALDAAEALEVDHNFDEDVDTDSEEEAFVNSLAEKLMASSKNGKADYDDEDPDMEDWSDFDDDNDADAMENGPISEETSEDSQNKADTNEGVDGDDFMDDFNDDSDEEAREGIPSSDDSNDGDVALVVGSDSEEDEANKKQKTATKRITESFADASEYEDIIEKAWKDRKRPMEVAADSEDGNIDDHVNRKRRKHRKKGRKS